MSGAIPLPPYMPSWRRPWLTNLWDECPKWQSESFPWHTPFTGPNFSFISFARPKSLYWEEYQCVYRLYMNYRCYQITLQWNIFTQIGSGSVCWLDIYRWGAGLEVTGHYVTLDRITSTFIPTSRSCLLRTAHHKKTHTHTHLTRNYISGHIYQHFIITTHYRIVFCHIMIHCFS
jgi:hypothetical protein